MGRVDGLTALITGAARGQGRSHAVRLAEEGADIVAIDAAEDVATVNYPMARPADLEETKAQVERLGRRCITVLADVRDQTAMDDAVAQCLTAFGHLDIVVANAGIASFGATWELPEQTWQDVIDINLTGVWHTVKSAAPAMIAGGRGGSIALISSVAGLKGMATIAHYSAAKHGLVGLARTLANELAPHRIRVNSIHPTNVATDMILNEPMYRQLRDDLEHPTLDDVLEGMVAMHVLEVPWVESIDVSNAVLWLASDEARYITGVALPVDAGLTVK
jgi:SDR family mycofactocin-dependent oxidoreductase